MDMTEVKNFDLQVGKLKLSAAMRIGARIRPQAFGIFFEHGASCAIGAAYEARTGRTIEGVNSAPAEAEFPELFMAPKRFSELGSAIYKRNDKGQSREQIADWLESQGL